MLTRKPTVGGGAGFSGACGLPSAWRVLRPLPWPRRFSAKATRGPAPGIHVNAGGGGERERLLTEPAHGEDSRNIFYRKGGPGVESWLCDHCAPALHLR